MSRVGSSASSAPLGQAMPTVIAKSNRHRVSQGSRIPASAATRRASGASLATNTSGSTTTTQALDNLEGRLARLAMHHDRSVKCPPRMTRGLTTAFDHSPDSLLQANMETMRSRTHQLLKSQRFDGAIGVVILVNSLVIGFESEAELSNADTSMFVLMEQFFLCIYMLELGLRFFAHTGCNVSRTNGSALTFFWWLAAFYLVGWLSQ